MYKCCLVLHGWCLKIVSADALSRNKKLLCLVLSQLSPLCFLSFDELSETYKGISQKTKQLIF